MEIRHMHIVVALTIIFLGALYLFLEESAKPPGPTPEEIGKELLLKSIAFGQNSSTYRYSYFEYSDGFPERYTLISEGKASSIDVESPISKKTIYDLEDETIMCISFQGNQSCSSIKNETLTASYLASMRSRLFDQERAKKEASDTEYRIENNMQMLAPSIKNKDVNGKRCTEIRYVIDYSNATYGDMQRFNIFPGSPVHFEAITCIENRTGEMFESNFNYTFQGKLHTSRFELVETELDSDSRVRAPANISGNAIGLLIIENSYKNELLKCYQKPGSEKDRCIALMALQLRSRDLCGYSGARKDRCLVSIMPYIKDSSVCQEIESADYKDDCYSELAGAFKNESWCDNVIDPMKKQDCVDFAKMTDIPKPAETKNETLNATENQSETPDLIKEIFEKMENQGNSTG